MDADSLDRFRRKCKFPVREAVLLEDGEIRCGTTRPSGYVCNRLLGASMGPSGDNVWLCHKCKCWSYLPGNA